jgi:RNA polymerase sigma-70 factor (ECF subfamily)
MVEISHMPKPDREQFERLLGPVHEAAFRFCLRLCTTRADAEDLYHDAILAAWQGLSGLKDPERFGPWFFQIVINTFRNRSRRQRWRHWLPWVDDAEQLINAPSLSIDPRGRLDARRWLAVGFDALSADDRSLIVLFELEEHSVAELARVWNCPEGTIKSRLARARTKMRDAIMQKRAGSVVEPTSKPEVDYGLHPNPQPSE